jgi:hypothetical protein
MARLFYSVPHPNKKIDRICCHPFADLKLGFCCGSLKDVVGGCVSEVLRWTVLRVDGTITIAGPRSAVFVLSVCRAERVFRRQTTLRGDAQRLSQYQYH